MARNNEEQKRIEAWFLNKAREAGVPIPLYEIPDEEPDFRFQTPSGALGIELSEVLRPASSNYGILPAAEEAFHNEIIEDAKCAYYANPNAAPVHVNAYFTNTRGEKRSKQDLTKALVGFVQANVHRANPALVSMHDEAPEGFDSVLIVAQSNPDNWWSGEGGGISLSEIRPQVEARITAKDKLVETYRSNLPDAASVWLLLYTGVSVARSMPIPHGIDEWRIPFRFDRVFWFTALERQFVEIHRADSANAIAV